MHQIKFVKSTELFPIIKEIFDNNSIACIAVTGMSMYPFLREKIDSVELSPPDFKGMNRGDIVLIRREDGEYVLHRVVRKNRDHFYIAGDAQQLIEGPLHRDQLVAVVTSVRRREKKIKCNNFIWRLLSSIWTLLLPLRRFIIKSYIFLRNIHNII